MGRRGAPALPARPFHLGLCFASRRTAARDAPCACWACGAANVLLCDTSALLTVCRCGNANAHTAFAARTSHRNAKRISFRARWPQPIAAAACRQPPHSSRPTWTSAKLALWQCSCPRMRTTSLAPRRCRTHPIESPRLQSCIRQKTSWPRRRQKRSAKRTKKRERGSAPGSGRGARSEGGAEES